MNDVEPKWKFYLWWTIIGIFIYGSIYFVAFQAKAFMALFAIQFILGISILIYALIDFLKNK